MIKDPLGIVAVLLVIEGLVIYASEMPRLRWFFKVVPFMFLIYLLPMVVGTIGLIPPELGPDKKVITPIYGAIVKYCLPASLILLLINVDLRAILRLGGVAIAVMAAGALGVMVGGPVVLAIFGRWLPPDMWTGFGALSASWMGGTTNLVAVAKGVETSREIYGMVMVADPVVAYAWMSMLMIMAGRQAKFDRWNRSRMGMLEELRRRASAEAACEAHPLSIRGIVLMFTMAVCGTALAMWGGAKLLEVSRMMSAFTWAIILASVFGLILSLTPARRLARFGTHSVGYGLLYFVLAAIGATADLTLLASVPVLVLAGLVWVIIHGIFLLTAGRLLRAPLALIATASQANIGGVVSAPVVAEVYQTGLAPVALLLGVLGNVLGTYLGLCCAALCRMVSQW